MQRVSRPMLVVIVMAVAGCYGKSDIDISAGGSGIMPTVSTESPSESESGTSTVGSSTGDGLSGSGTVEGTSTTMEGTVTSGEEDSSDADTDSGPTTSGEEESTGDMAMCDDEGARRTIFVSSDEYTGDLMGLDGADGKCNDLARRRVEGTYMAWLSSAEESAKDRLGAELDGFDGCFVLADESKTVVAVGWTDMHDGLLSGELVHPINVTEEGTVVSDNVWTGTKMDGEAVAGMLSLAYCGDWTNQSSADCTFVTPCGRIGSTQPGGEGWTNQAWSSCEKMHRIYCVQVEP